MLWQADYVNKRLGTDEAFLPNNACGDPDKEKITTDIRLVFMDSQWWLEDWKRVQDMNKGCEFKDRFGFLLELEDDLKKYDKATVTRACDALEDSLQMVAEPA